MSRAIAVALCMSVVMAMTISATAKAQQPPEYPTFGSIVPDEANAERFRALIPEGSQLQQVAEGLDWSEGPVWMKDGGFVLFSDIPRNVIMKWKEGEGLSIFLRPAGYTGPGSWGPEPGTNGLATDLEGRLIMANHGDRRIGRMEPTGNQTTLVNMYEGKKLNSPNDLVVKRSNGDIYFTDPPYGLPTQRPEDPNAELDFCGVYRLSADGKLTLLTRDMTRPNGIGLSPDERTLYVAQSDRAAPIWMAFTLNEQGTIESSREFASAQGMTGSGLPDGMAVDQAGNVFATGPGGVHIFTPDGTHLGLIATGQNTGNCTFGGDDGSTLYVVADMFLGRIKTNTKGIGF